MPKHFLMLIIGLFFGAGAGFLIAAANDATLSGHDHASHGTAHPEMDMHDHSAQLEVSADLPTPKLSLELIPEGQGAWNLHIMTSDFRFAPENVNSPAQPGEGHAHIYVDGVKYARVYGPWVHVSGLPEDAEVLTVTLNANTHETLAVGGLPIQALVSLRQ